MRFATLEGVPARRLQALDTCWEPRESTTTRQGMEDRIKPAGEKSHASTWNMTVENQRDKITDTAWYLRGCP